MRSFVLFTASFVLAGLSGVLGFEFQRIRKNDTMLLVVDHQIGLFELVKDFEPVEYRNNILAHATLGKVFDLPTILTTSTDDGNFYYVILNSLWITDPTNPGPNGPMMQEILDMHSDAPLIRRQGEVNAWDNAEFRAAVQATGKKQVILGGIVTDVCTAFLALSLLEEGYEVFANSEASGTYSRRIADEANDRMRAAGVNVLSMFAVATDLMRDWRQTPGYPELSPYFDQYFPVYGMVERNFKAANKTA
ncbi:ycac protein [Moniliophthora roreri]|nr:ycac protein [Moniliophthora roreri]